MLTLTVAPPYCHHQSFHHRHDLLPSSHHAASGWNRNEHYAFRHRGEPNSAPRRQSSSTPRRRCGEGLFPRVSWMLPLLRVLQGKLRMLCRHHLLSLRNVLLIDLKSGSEARWRWRWSCQWGSDCTSWLFMDMTRSLTKKGACLDHTETRAFWS